MTTISQFKFNINIQENSKIPRYSGRIVQGAFLQYLRILDPSLSIDLHEGNPMRTYVTSNIYRRRNEESNLMYFDVYTIDPRIIDILVKIMVGGEGTQIYLIDKMYNISHIDFTVHDISSKELLPIRTNVLVKFITPTLFANSKRNNNLDAFPVQKRMWANMITSYKYIVAPINEEEEIELIQRLEDQLSITDFKIENRRIRLGNNIHLNGVTGYINYFIENNEGLELLRSILSLANHWGIGGKRSMGMGRVHISFRYPKVKKPNEVDLIKKLDNIDTVLMN
ncbi:MAG: CRISPR system precrRNA processing endoribonuclease RAMP protein Cas6 [Candidatus Heimdallarchaeota archaeon]|nr:CRISPR system precrRNA processing endoribonuclease RAMP protein Cas6 [Candidatus Heimdallarchaeota archaeon]